jgi:ABC-2 type transport system permease protein
MILSETALSFIGLGMEKIGGGQHINSDYLVLYLLIGTLVWRFLSTIFYWITELISIERWEGTIEYTLMAPVRRATHMAGQTIFAMIYALFFTGVILLVVARILQIDLAGANFASGAVMVWPAASRLWGSALWLLCSRCCFLSAGRR